MTTTRQKNRNYRRKPASSSSPDDSDRGFQDSPTPPPPLASVVVVAVSTNPSAPSAASPSSCSADSGGCSNSSAVLGRGIGDGDGGREVEDAGRDEEEGERREGRRKGEEDGGGIRGRTGGDRELSQSFGEGVAPPTGRGGSQNGAKRIASGVGYNMLKSMGWRENTGLGQLGNGIVDPILPTKKPKHLGIGFKPTAAHDAAQEEIKQLQKVKREERDRKLQQKLEKSRVAEEEAIFMRESSVAMPSISYEHLPESSARLQGVSSDPHHSKTPAGVQGHKPTEPGQCPHCKQRFDTKHALKSHINARHAKLLLAAKRQFKKERRKGGNRHGGGGTSSWSGKRGLARSLAPMSQDFSVYD